MRRGWTSQGAVTSFRHGRESAAAVGSGEEKTVLSLIRRPEGLNHLSTSPTSTIDFRSSLCFLFLCFFKLEFTYCSSFRNCFLD